MKFQLFFVFLLFSMKKATTDYIECYVCEDCEENEGELVSCALLGELQLIDELVDSEAGTAPLISTTQATTIAEESNKTTLANFEDPATTIATIKQNLTTVSIPNAIDSMESYEDMDWEPQGSVTTTQLNKETTNGTSAQNETLLVNATTIAETAEATVTGTVLLPETTPNVSANSTSTLYPNITMNPTDVHGLNTTTSETSLDSSLVDPKPNVTSATVIGNITDTISSTVNTSLPLNTTIATGVLQLNGTTTTLLENGTTNFVGLNGTTQINATTVSSANVTATGISASGNETTSPVGFNETTLNFGNGTTTGVLALGNETTASVGPNGTTPGNATTLSSANVATSETISSVGPNTTAQGNTTTVSSPNATTTVISTLENNTTSTVGLNETTLNFGNGTTTGVLALGNETTASMGPNGTTQLNTTTVSSGDVTSTGVSTFGSETTASMGPNGTTTGIFTLGNETMSSGPNATAQGNTTTINSANVTATEISTLGNETEASVGPTVTTPGNGTTVSSGNVTTTGISALGNETISSGPNATTQVNTTTVNSANVAEISILGNETMSSVGPNGVTLVNTTTLSSLGPNGTTQGNASIVNSGNETTGENSSPGSGSMNTTFTLTQGNSTAAEIQELTNATNVNIPNVIPTINQNGTLQNINGTAQNIPTATLSPNLVVNITSGTTNTTSTSSNTTITSSSQAGHVLSEEYSDEDDSKFIADSEEGFLKSSKTYLELGGNKNTLNANETPRKTGKRKPLLTKRSSTDFLLNKYSKLRYAAGLKQVNVTYKCYTVRVKGKDKMQINKGCIAVPAKRTACELLATKYGEKAMQDCKVCSEGKCNNRSRSSAVKFSMASFMATILIAWLLS